MPFSKTLMMESAEKEIEREKTELDEMAPAVKGVLDECVNAVVVFNSAPSIFASDWEQNEIENAEEADAKRTGDSENSTAQIAFPSPEKNQPLCERISPSEEHAEYADSTPTSGADSCPLSSFDDAEIFGWHS